MLLIAALLAPLDCSTYWIDVQRARPTTRADTVAVATDLQSTEARCARLVAAYLRALTTSSITAADERHELDSTLQSLFSTYSQEPRIYVALAFLRLRDGALSTAARLFRRAEDRAEAAAVPLDSHERAIIAYGQGRVKQAEWRDWRSFGQLMGMTRGQWDCPELDLEIEMNIGKGGAGAAAASGILPSIVQFNFACPELFERLVDDDFRQLSDLKSDSRRDLERYYRQALEIDPGLWQAAQALSSELIFEASWHELRTFVNLLVARFPDRYEPLIMLALAERASGNDSLATVLFQRAIIQLPDSMKSAYTSPELVLRLSESQVFADQPPSMRRQLSSAYWRSRQVMFLADGNERLLEHYVRVATADLLFRDPDGGEPGWATNVGGVWIRYGRPLKIRELAIKNGRASFWSYGPDPDFVFTRFLTYRTHLVHEDASPAFHQLEEEQPTRFRPSDVDAVRSLDRQIARFRGRDGGGELIVLAPHPLGTVGSPDEGVTLLDAEFRTIARWRGPARGDGLRVTLTSLRPGTYSVVTEALDRAGRLLYQSRDTLTIPEPSAYLALSDILLIKQIDGPSQAANRSEVDFDWLYGSSISAAATLGLYWEIYGSREDEPGPREYRITVDVRDATERSLLTRIVRSVGRGFRRERPTTRLEYTRISDTAPKTVEWLNLRGDWLAGKSYDVRVTVVETQTGRTASASRRFDVR